MGPWMSDLTDFAMFDVGASLLVAAMSDIPAPEPSRPSPEASKLQRDV